MEFSITPGAGLVTISFHPAVNYQNAANGGTNGANNWSNAQFVIRFPTTAGITLGAVNNLTQFTFSDLFTPILGGPYDASVDAQNLVDPDQNFLYEAYTFNGNAVQAFTAGTPVPIVEIAITAGDPTLVELTEDPDFTEPNPFFGNLFPSLTNGIWGEEYAGILNNAVQPVEWMGFKATPTSARSVRLDWGTITEVNNSHFNIERSWEGRIFEQIGRVQGNGSTKAVNVYDFHDKNVLFDKVYYRLKQVDFNGDFEFSEMVEVTLGDAKIASLPIMEFFPNPATDKIHVASMSRLTHTYILDISDLTGKSMGEYMLTKEKPEIDINVSNFPEGVYLVSVRNPESISSWGIGKFVKQ